MALAPGICLTFDDIFVRDWCQARHIFDKFNARATFCVCRVHRAGKETIKGLQLLQSEGHEIGFHSRNHRPLLAYLENNGLKHWLQHEIDEGIEDHHRFGFPATSFAYPFHRSTPKTRARTAKRFKIVRAVGPKSVREDTLANRVYTKLGPDKVVNAIGMADMQHPSFINWKWQYKVLDTIVEQGGVGVFAGHNILPERDKKGYYSSYFQIQRLCQAAIDRGLRFYTLSEFADLVA